MIACFNSIISEAKGISIVADPKPVRLATEAAIKAMTKNKTIGSTLLTPYYSIILPKQKASLLVVFFKYLIHQLSDFPSCFLKYR